MRAYFGVFAALFGAFLASGCGGDDGPDSKKGTDSPDPGTPDGYCGSKTPDLIAAAGDPDMALAPLSEEPVAGSACNAVIRTYPPPANVSHVTTCSAVSYETNPPVYGNHYPLFPKFGVYKYAIPRGFYVHTLEHGGAVITYSCEDCGDEVAQAAELVKTLEIEAACCTADGCGDATNRMLLTPDPGIATRWAASAWGYSLTADCFEPEVFQAFAEQYRGLAPETICGNSYALDVSEPGLP
ncbi:MAG TPA: DUF3105 domain-containing protein [Polyangiaceae bacterium]|jgi:hypothetical protein|nr:DUF3105 domain-containing protein [Polyangiaceae bacterium]